jgi:hypothetical protein
MSSAHDRVHLDKAIKAFTDVGQKLGILKGQAA